LELIGIWIRIQEFLKDSSTIAIEIGHFPQFVSYLWKKNCSDLHENFITDFSVDMKSG